MNNLNEMVERYIVKYDRKIKSICAPLKDCFGISLFGHFVLEADGQFVDLCNQPGLIEFYYQEQLFMQDPYMSHPSLLRSGYVFIPNDYNPTFFQSWHNQFEMRNLFIILDHHEDTLECSYFSILKSDKASPIVFLHEIDSLRKFIRYFKRETKSLVVQMKADKFNVKEVKGEAFLKPQEEAPLSNKDPNIQKFLNLIMPLSHRERQCFDLFKRGYSAQATGAILGLSPRTVEFYFENIKNKLGCSSKAKLMAW